jgi:hypothetical protein
LHDLSNTWFSKNAGPAKMKDFITMLIHYADAHLENRGWLLNLMVLGFVQFNRGVVIFPGSFAIFPWPSAIFLRPFAIFPRPFVIFP